jgi:hypothetical protein
MASRISGGRLGLIFMTCKYTLLVVNNSICVLALVKTGSCNWFV